MRHPSFFCQNKSKYICIYKNIKYICRVKLKHINYGTKTKAMKKKDVYRIAEILSEKFQMGNPINGFEPMDDNNMVELLKKRYSNGDKYKKLLDDLNANREIISKQITMEKKKFNKKVDLRFKVTFTDVFNSEEDWRTSYDRDSKYSQELYVLIDKVNTQIELFLNDRSNDAKSELKKLTFDPL